jgi:hypothetical protein
VQPNVDQTNGEVFTDLFSDEDGIVPDADAPKRWQQFSPSEAMHLGRQHMVTQIELLSFFKSVPAATERRRLDAKNYCKHILCENLLRPGFDWLLPRSKLRE